MNAANPKLEIQNPKYHRPVLRPPQFGLRTLLLLVTGCGVLLALAQWLSPMVVLGLALLAISIFLHVAGNCIGTRLRAIGDCLPKEAAATNILKSRPQEHEYAPRTRLGQRHGLGWMIVVATLSGIIVGGIGGGVWTIITGRGEVGALNVGVGVIAFATLGGLAAFAIVGFTQVLLGAIWQAMQHSQSSDS